jgi:hypothetical protein
LLRSAATPPALTACSDLFPDHREPFPLVLGAAFCSTELSRVVEIGIAGSVKEQLAAAGANTNSSLHACSHASRSGLFIPLR